MLQLLIRLYKFCQAMTVHLRHLNIRNEKSYLVTYVVSEILVAFYVIERVLAVGKGNNIFKSRRVKRIHYHFIEQRTVFRNNHMTFKVNVFML